MKRYFTYILIIITFTNSYTQNNLPKLNGSFLLQTYLPKEYNANPQIFDIVQDSRGIMYFSNQKGVLEYDGVHWETIPIGKEDLRVLSLAKGENGLVYAGANGDFGMLFPDSLGRLMFVSQLKNLRIDSIGRVSQIIIRNNTKYLKTPKELFIIDSLGVSIIRCETKIKWISLLDGKLYVLQKDIGLFVLEDNELVSLNEGYQFANKDIVAAMNFNHRHLIVSSQNGIYELTKKGSIVKLHLVEGQTLLSAIPINDNLISLGTISDGIIILDTNFNVVYKVGLEKGISDAAIKTQFIDKEKNLWLGTNVGITKIEISSPILKFDLTVGLRSGIQSIARFNNKLYVATLDGVYYMNDEGMFKNIGDIEKDCYGLQTLKLEGDSLLFVAELNSVISVDKDNKKKLLQKGGPYDFKKSPLNPNEIIVLHYDGLANLIYKDGKFTTQNYIKNITTAELFNFIVQEDGTIWIGTLKDANSGVYKTHVNVFRDSTIAFERFNTDSGLPVGAAYLFEFENNIYVGTDKGLYKYENKKFKKYNDFGVDFSSGRGVHRIDKDKKGNIWMVLFDEDNNYEIGYSSLVDGKYVWNSKMFTRHSEEIIHSLYHESNGISWLGGPEGLIRYDSKIKNDYKINFNALIRTVKFGDSLLFGGSYEQSGMLNLTQPVGIDFKIEYSANKPITFSFASTSYIDEKKTEYSIMLENHADDWSHWSKRIMKEYYLPEGEYSFKVKARNIYGVVTDVTIFNFEVLPPWYRTSWAYILYFFGFIVFVYILIRLSLRRVKQQNIKLEGIIEERTKEVVVQKQDAEKQRDIAERQKELVEEKNKEILDSITYAKRLQDAILPPEKLFQKNLPNSFVYYKPKDIVAGDFYWMEELKGGGVLFAAADCTGHGVPGAMVSVVCSNALDRTVKEFGFTNPGKVLDKVTDLVIEKFEKSDEEVKDGMDIGLCKLKYDKGFLKATIEYAGANNPLWIVTARKDIGINNSLNIELNNLYLHEIKATKQPVGKYAKRKPFDSHKIELEEGDVFYLFTDGFADQFGGPKEKKYMYKPFKRLLLSNNNKTMPDQMKIIDKEFEEWKGNFEQIDDVCIIGVRI